MSKPIARIVAPDKFWESGDNITLIKYIKTIGYDVSTNYSYVNPKIVNTLNQLGVIRCTFDYVKVIILATNNNIFKGDESAWYHEHLYYIRCKTPVYLAYRGVASGMYALYGTKVSKLVNNKIYIEGIPGTQCSIYDYLKTLSKPDKSVDIVESVNYEAAVPALNTKSTYKVDELILHKYTVITVEDIALLLL